MRNAEVIELARVAAREAITIPTVITDLTDVSGTPATGDLLQYDGSGWVPATLSTSFTVPFGLAMVADGGGSEIADGITVGYYTFNFAATITGWAIVNTPSGSIQWDILRDGASIVASAPPSVTGSTGNDSTTLTGWTTSISAGHTLTFAVTSATTSTLSSLTLHLTREIS